MPSLRPEEIRRGQLAAMVEWAIAGARNQPLVLVLEDLQWFDPTSIDLVQALSDAARRRQFSFWRRRDPNSASLGVREPHHHVISLAPLDEAQVQRMIAELASRHALSTDVMRRVSERAAACRCSSRR